MIVYHGSYTEIVEIDLSQATPNKDFGRGFYVTKIREQAEKRESSVTISQLILYGYILISC